MRYSYSPHAAADTQPETRSPRSTYSRASEETKRLVCEDYVAGYTLLQITQRRKVRESSIYNFLAEYDVPKRKKEQSIDDFNLSELRLIDSIRNGVSIGVASHLAGFEVRAALVVLTRAVYAMRLSPEQRDAAQRT